MYDLKQKLLKKKKKKIISRCFWLFVLSQVWRCSVKHALFSSFTHLRCFHSSRSLWPSSLWARPLHKHPIILVCHSTTGAILLLARPLWVFIHLAISRGVWRPHCLLAQHGSPPPTHPHPPRRGVGTAARRLWNVFWLCRSHFRCCHVTHLPPERQKTRQACAGP